MRIFRYFLYALRYPDLREFLDMGLGIEARYARCREAWRPHLESCKEFQRASFEAYPARESELVICGAGRGLDIDSSSALRHFSSILLLDADPLAKRSCLKKFGNAAAVQYELVELSSALQEWTSTLQKMLATHTPTPSAKQIADLLISLRSRGFSLPAPRIPRTVLSLNLLSQIPIYWRLVVHRMLKKHLGVEVDAQDNLPVEYQHALHVSCAELQRAHLHALAATNSDEILCIYDTAFVYHQGAHEVLREQALFVQLADVLSGYELLQSTNWNWNIAPQQVEFAEYGIVHEVRAERYRKL